MNALNELQKLDIIEVTESFTRKILDLYTEKPMGDIHFFLKEGVLKSYDEDLKCTNYGYFKVSDNGMVTLNHYFMAGHRFAQILNAEIDMSKTVLTGNIKYKTIYVADENEDLAYTIVIEFLATFAYITELMDNRETVIKETYRRQEVRPGNPANKRKSKRKKYENKRIVTLGTDKVEYVTITTDKNNEEMDDVVKRRYTRRTGSWTVRGHYRRYKSGKVVYIAPHTRGEGERKPKTYRP